MKQNFRFQMGVKKILVSNGFKKSLGFKRW